MFSAIVFIIVLGILILVHEFGHFVTAKRMGVTVEQFSLGFGPRLFGWKKGSTEYTICAIPLGGYVKLAGDNPEEFKGRPDEYLAKSVSQRVKIIFSGPLLNYLLAFLCFWLIFFIGFPNLTCRVGGLVDNFGAQEAGVQVGDNIFAVDGKAVKIWQELQNIIQNKIEGDMVRLSIIRNSQELHIPVKIKQEKMDTIWGEKKTIGLIGIKPSEEFIKIRYGLVRSFLLGGERLFHLTWLTFKSLAWMVMGRISFRQSVTGPLGIFYITKEAANLGFIPLIQVIAVIIFHQAQVNNLKLIQIDLMDAIFFNFWDK